MTVQVIKAKKKIPGLKQDGAVSSGKKIRVAAYCRVSTDSEEQETSFEAQKKHYLDTINNHPEWILAGIYADEGITGTSVRKREEFQRMIKDCDNGLIDMVITKSISRWARNTIDSLKHIRHLKELEIPVYFEKENINTLESSGEVLITIMSSLAQQESDSISKNVRLGLQYKMQLGKGILNTNLFLGYRWNDGKLEIIPEEAKIVRRIYREYLEGFTPGMIAKRLMEDGVCSPGGKETWYQTTIKSILENEKYAGDLLLQKYYVEDFLTHKVVKNSGQFPKYYVEADHDPIIPKTLFLQVQAEIKRRLPQKNDPCKRRYGSRIVFSGRLECGLCRQHLKQRILASGTIWRCSGSSCRHNGIPSAETGMPSSFMASYEKELQEAVISAFNRLTEKRDELLKLQGAITGGSLHRMDQMISHLQNLIEQLEEKIGIYSGEIREYLAEQSEELRDKLNSYILERAEYANREISVIICLELVNEMYNRRNALWNPAGLKKCCERDRMTSDEELPAQNNNEAFGRCCKKEEFFRITKVVFPENLMSKSGYIHKFDNAMVIRYIEKIIVWKDFFEVWFKAGIVIRTERKPV